MSERTPPPVRSEPEYPYVRVILETKRDGRQVPGRLIYRDPVKDFACELGGVIVDATTIHPGAFTEVELRMQAVVEIVPYVETERPDGG